MKKKNIKKTQQLIPETEPLLDEDKLNFEEDEQLISAAEFRALINKVIELQYESKFDGFLVDLRVGDAEAVNDRMFGGEQVFTYKCGATVSSDIISAETFGCLVWLERFDGSPNSIATLFHELVHASVLRFEKSGVFKRLPKPKDVRGGLVAFDELIANSVSELGSAFLAMLSEQK